MTSRAVELRGEHQARARRLAVDQHRARAADAVLAAGVGAGEVELVAQEVRAASVRGSTSTSCADAVDGDVRRTFSGIRGSFPGALGGALHGPAGHHDGEVAAEVGRAVGVARRVEVARGAVGRARDRVLGRLGAGERRPRPRSRGPGVGADAAERDARRGDRRRRRPA